MEPRGTACDAEPATPRNSRVHEIGRRLPLNGLTAMLTVSLLAMLPGMAAALPNGCVDSPENPSVILALAGGTVVGLSYMWTRWRAK